MAPLRRLHRLRRGLGALRREPGRRDGPLRRTPTRSSASSPTRCGGPSAWWWTPACTPWAGRAQQAIDYFKANAGKAEHDIEVEVDRYIVWPGQALAYKIGELKIKELRAYAEKELGPTFDLRAFHDQVLGNGALPLDLLEKNIKAWVAEEKGKGA